jgi:hypothetical protein
MVSYFARHEVDQQGSSWETYGKGRQAWDGCGGDSHACSHDSSAVTNRLTPMAPAARKTQSIKQPSMKRGAIEEDKINYFCAYSVLPNQIPAAPCNCSEIPVEKTKLGGYSPVSGGGARCLGNF